MDIKGLISKINDRNIQRKRESGFTSYALISIVFLILYHAFETFPLIKLSENTGLKIIIVSITLNICTFTSFIILLHRNRNTSDSIKVFSNTEEHFLFSKIPLFLLFTTPIALFYYSLFQENYFLFNTNIFYVAVFSFFYSAILTGLIIALVKMANESRNKVLNIQSSGNIFKNSILYYLISLSLISISFYELFSISTAFSKRELIDFVVSIYLVIILLDRIVIINESDIYAQKLEIFEQEIILNDLSDEAIKEALKKNFLGIFLDEWIENKKNVLNIRCEEFKNSILGKEELKTRILEIDKTSLPYEYTGRKSNIEMKF